MGRDIVESLNLPAHPGPTRDSEQPLFDPHDIAGLIPGRNQENMDIRKVGQAILMIVGFGYSECIVLMKLTHLIPDEEVF